MPDYQLPKNLGFLACSQRVADRSCTPKKIWGFFACSQRVADRSCTPKKIWGFFACSQRVADRSCTPKKFGAFLPARSGLLTAAARRKKNWGFFSANQSSFLRAQAHSLCALFPLGTPFLTLSWKKNSPAGGCFAFQPRQILFQVRLSTRVLENVSHWRHEICGRH
jgi:hypothetical protein